GRAIDPRRADEVVVSEKLAGELGVTVGDDLTLVSMTDDWVDLAYHGGDPGPPDGPTIHTHVGGLERSPPDFGRKGLVVRLSPAFLREYQGRMRMYGGVDARLAGAPSSALRARLTHIAGEGEVDGSAFADDGTTTDALSTIARALRIIAAVAAVA